MAEPATIHGLVSALERHNAAKILAWPTVVTTDGSTFEVKHPESGAHLDVTAKVLDGKHIRVEIRPRGEQIAPNPHALQRRIGAGGFLIALGNGHGRVDFRGVMLGQQAGVAQGGSDRTMVLALDHRDDCFFAIAGALTTLDQRSGCQPAARQEQDQEGKAIGEQCTH